MPKSKRNGAGAAAKRARGGAGGARGGGGAADDDQWPALAGLVAPTGVGEFLGDVFERRPLLCRAGKEGAARFSGLFTLEQLYALLDDAKRGSPLQFVRHINACKFVDGRKVMCNPPADGGDDAGSEEGDSEDEGDESGSESGGSASSGEDEEEYATATSAAVRRLFDDDGCTLQFHQPQHHSAELAGLMARLEAELGCLVGSNAYLTPAGAQGLAPHHDDIEAFVLQVEGRKHWRVYEPVVELPRGPSGDLDAADLGQPALEVVLEPGDVLYFPRGWVHQADTPADTISTHITISTYQRHTWGDLLAASVPLGIDAACDASVELRRGLPPRFAAAVGAAFAGGAATGGAGGDGVDGGDGPRRAKRARALPDAAAQASTSVRESAARTVRQLLASDAVVDAVVDACLGAGADQFFVDFVSARLPPPAAAARGKRNGGPPGASVGMRLVDPLAIRVVEAAEDDAVQVFHSMHNTADDHMLGGRGDGVLVFPSDVAPVLRALLRAHPAVVTRRQLVDATGCESAAVGGVVTRLWMEGVLATE